jgi:hypothetical protein
MSKARPTIAIVASDAKKVAQMPETALTVIHKTRFDCPGMMIWTTADGISSTALNRVRRAPRQHTHTARWLQPNRTGRHGTKGTKKPAF